jgi:lysophospholipase L1-like esterase
VVFGDSIAAGLGARGQSFGSLVAADLGATLTDHSLSATMVSRSVVVAADGPEADLGIVMHGISEALPRVKANQLARLPRRWRGAGRLDPRPYFSARGHKRLLQHAESAARWRAKVVLMSLAGTEQWIALPDYRRELGALLDQLEGCRQVLVLGPTPIEDRYFPGASRALRDYAQAGQEAAAEHGRVFVALDDVLDQWDDFLADHFHPTAGGHRKIADHVIEVIAGMPALR